MIVVPTNDRTYATTTERIEITRNSPDVVSMNVYLNPKEESDRAIVAFNQHVHADKRVEAVMLTVRDGMTLAYKR